MNRTGLLALIVLLLIAILIVLLINQQLSKRNQQEIFDAIEDVNTDKIAPSEDDFEQITPDTTVETHEDKTVTLTAEGAIYGTAGLTEINTQEKLGLSYAQFGKSESLLLTTSLNTLPLKQSNEEFRVWLFNSLGNRYLPLGLLTLDPKGKYTNQFFTSKAEFDQYDSVLLSLDPIDSEQKNPFKTIAIGKYFISKQIIDEF